MSLQVVSRPQDKYVEKPWRQWRSAHVQVELAGGDKLFPKQFRELAIQTAKCRNAIIAPE